MTISEVLEIESTFEVGPDTPIPTADAFSPLVADPAVDHHLSATYYDTADLSLTRHRVTLRRRTGGDDAGWHLKLPTRAGRVELHAPLSDDLPSSLLEAVAGLVRRRPLAPIARIDNRRRVQLLRDADGTAVIEFCDDRVSTESYLDGGSASRWREWEAELVDPSLRGAHARLADVAAACTAAGATISSSSSKLARAVGPVPDPVDTSDSAIRGALLRDLRQLLDHDPGARRCRMTGVHQMRVAVRGLRSTIRTYLPELEAGTADTDLDPKQLLSDLKLLAGVLGAVRDIQVVDERLGRLMAEYPDEVISPRTRQRVDTELRSDLQRAGRRLTATLGSDRYLDLLDGLDQLVRTDIPPTVKKKRKHDRSPGAAPGAALRGVDRQFSRFHRIHTRTERDLISLDLTLAQREELTHVVRKRAKALRRNVAAVQETDGLIIAPLRDACDRLHTVLGDVQDSVTARQWIRRIERRAASAGEPTFGYGVLFERERAFSEATLTGYESDATAVIAAYRELAETRA